MYLWIYFHLLHCLSPTWMDYSRLMVKWLEGPIGWYIKNIIELNYRVSGHLFHGLSLICKISIRVIFCQVSNLYPTGGLVNSHERPHFVVRFWYQDNFLLAYSMESPELFFIYKRTVIISKNLELSAYHSTRQSVKSNCWSVTAKNAKTRCWGVCNTHW